MSHTLDRSAIGIRQSREYRVTFWSAALALRDRVRGCMARARQRRMLADFDDRLLNDIGLTRRQAEQEASKLMWR